MENTERVSVTDVEGRSSWQFGLIDLFAIVTLAALLSAMAAPHVREMSSENRVWLLVVAGLQFLVTTVSFALAMFQRKQLQMNSGRKMGIAPCGVIRWRHWPMVKSILLMLLFATVQLLAALMFAQESNRGSSMFNFMLMQMQLCSFAGYAFARFLWRSYPGTIEVFDNGIAVGGVMFYPWANVDVRTSHLVADRLVVVLRDSSGSASACTKMAQVSDGLREQIFAVVAAERESNWAVCEERSNG